MKKLVLYFVLIVLLSLLLVGCSESENPSDKEDYNEARAAAWEFIQEKGWHRTAKENWQSAEVTQVVIDTNYELVDKNYEGKEALAVSFEDDNNSVVSTPVILIEPGTNEVLGYMRGE